MSFTQYSPSNVHFMFGPLIVDSFADDTFIEVERDEDGFTTYTGALGDVCRTRNLNRTGKITVTLMASAPINSRLAAMATIDEDDATEVYPIQMVDTSGTLVCDGPEGWIMKQPKIERGKDAGTVQWVFAVAKLTIIAAGNDV